MERMYTLEKDLAIISSQRTSKHNWGVKRYLLHESQAPSEAQLFIRK